MTCEERRIQQDPAEQERLNDELAREQGFKKCPSCSVLIEKTEGCNHMTCRCGAHICWICLGIYTPQTIYGHLQDAHGGIYNEIPAGVNREEQGENAFLAMQMQEIQRLERAHEALRQQFAQPAVPRAPIQAVHHPLNNAYGGVAGRQPVQAHGLAWEGAPNAVQVREEAERIRERRVREEAARIRERLEAAAVAERQQEATRQWARQEAGAAERRLEVIRERERQAEAAARRRREEEGGWCVVM